MSDFYVLFSTLGAASAEVKHTQTEVRLESKLYHISPHLSLSEL